MIECSPGVPTPSPEPTPSMFKRFFQYYYYHNDHSEDRTDSNIGDVCAFTCDDGHVISGSDSRICGDDGTWSGTRTTCESKNYIVL